MDNTAAKRKAPAQRKPAKGGLWERLKQYMAVGSFDLPFFLAVLVILSIGLVMLFSASYTYAYYREHGDSAYFFKRQLIFAVIGVAAMLVVSKINYQYLRVFAKPILALTWLLLVVARAIPAKFGDFHRWIPLGPFSFQPSEVAKFAIIIFCAYSMEKNHMRIIGKGFNKSSFAKKVEQNTNGRIRIYDSFALMCFYAAIIAVTAGLIYAEHHLSGALLVLGIGVAMMFLGEFRKHWFILLVVLGVIAVAIVIFRPEILGDYAAERIKLWVDKTYSPGDGRWQTNNSLYAIGSGGLFGVGLGNSKQKHMFVSQPQNDFVFSIVCEELGFVGATAILLIFVYLIYRAIKIGIHSRDRFGSFLCIGIAFQVGLQTALNIGVVTDTIPNTGISLPFFSYGGTSLVMLLGEMGIVLAVSRYSRLAKK